MAAKRAPLTISFRFNRVNGQLALSNSQVMYRKAVQYSTKGQQNKLQGGRDPESAGNSAETADPEDTSLLEGVIQNVGSQLGSLKRRDGSLSTEQDIGMVHTRPRMGLARALPQSHNETQSTPESHQTASMARMSQHRSATLKGSHGVWVTPQNTTRDRFNFPLANFATKTDPNDVTFNGIMFGKSASLARLHLCSKLTCSFPLQTPSLEAAIQVGRLLATNSPTSIHLD